MQMKLEENLKESSITCLILVWTKYLMFVRWFLRVFWWPNEAVSLINNFQEDRYGPQFH